MGAVERKWEMHIHSGWDLTTTSLKTELKETDNTPNTTTLSITSKTQTPNKDTNNNKNLIDVDIYSKKMVGHGFLFMTNAINSLKRKSRNLKESLMILFE